MRSKNIQAVTCFPIVPITHMVSLSYKRRCQSSCEAEMLHGKPSDLLGPDHLYGDLSEYWHVRDGMGDGESPLGLCVII